MRHPGIGESACALIAGITLGAWWDAPGTPGTPGIFLFVAAISLIAYAWRKHHVAALVVIVALGAAWQVVRHERVADDDVARFVTERARLAQVVGVIEGTPTFSSPWRGAMGRFHYLREPSTLAVLRVEQLMGERASGRLLLRVREMDRELGDGMRIEATGWLSPVRAPMNPGEMDYRQRLAERGVRGQISLPTSVNWRLVDRRVKRRFELPDLPGAAERALNVGTGDDPVRLGLLQTLLLGQWSTDLAGVDDQFRDVGLAHVLSISGAHLGILLGLVWLGCRLMLIRPPRAAMVVMAVLVLFLLAVPPCVPIVRAGIMAMVMCGAVWSGRRIDAKRVLALAAMIVLIWRPGDLFSPGFQLSFLVVAALIGLTDRCLEKLWPRAWLAPVVLGDHPPGADMAAMTMSPATVARWLVGYAVAGVIAFGAATPLVAYHYRIVSPHAVVLSLLVLPVLTAVLGLGYAKILIGLIAPAVSLALAGPLRWSADAMLGLVREAHGWPGATIRLSGEPSAAWCAGWLLLGWAAMSGKFAAQRAAGSAALAVMIGWTAWLNVPWDESGKIEATVHALAVGDGSCLVVRRGEDVLMFDCGSQRYFDVGLRSVNPALQWMGVRKIDTLVVSHSDIDHYCGVLDVADRVPVGRVWVSRAMIDEARAKPQGAVAFLFNGLRDRDVPVEIVSRGRAERGVRVLWPPAEETFERANDASIVLRVEMAGRHLLLTGDIQEEAITRLLAETGDDLRADIMELPHHGGVVDAAAALLDAASPAIVLQSCGRDRVRDERWLPLLQGRGVQRLVTARHGMVGVRVHTDRTMTVDTFADTVYDDAGE